MKQEDIGILPSNLKSVHLLLGTNNAIEVNGFCKKGTLIFTFTKKTNSKTAAIKLHREVKRFYKLNNIYGVEWYNKRGW